MNEYFKIRKLYTKITYRKKTNETFQDFCDKIESEARKENVKESKEELELFSKNKKNENNETFNNLLEERKNRSLKSFNQGIEFSKNISDSQLLDKEFLVNLSVKSLNSFFNRKALAKEEIIDMLQDLFNAKIDYKDFVERFALSENIQTTMPWGKRNKLLIDIQKVVRKSRGI